MKLADLGEFGFIDRIAARARMQEGVVIGIGDDAAALRPTPEFVTLVTADMLLEGVHFDLSWSDPRSLGRKSLAVNLSDIAAMGGRPRHCILSLGIPPDLPLEFLDLFMTGLLEMAAEHEVSLAGGDTCASARGFVVNVTLMGEQRPDRVITRSGAREGDLVMVSGTLGDSSLGLELLQDGVRDGFAVGRHLDPTPRVREGRRLADMMLPTAMIDISDGLLADLGHILEQSGRGAVIELEKLPLSACMSDYLRDHCPGGYRFPLSGGEDYELLFTLPPERKEIVTGLFAGLGTRITEIGRITGSGLEVISPDGAPFPLAAKGYNHFGSNGG